MGAVEFSIQPCSLSSGRQVVSPLLDRRERIGFLFVLFLEMNQSSVLVELHRSGTKFMTPHPILLAKMVPGAGIPLLNSEFFVGKHQEHDACENPDDCKLNQTLNT